MANYTGKYDLKIIYRLGNMQGSTSPVESINTNISAEILGRQLQKIL